MCKNIVIVLFLALATISFADYSFANKGTKGEKGDDVANKEKGDKGEGIASKEKDKPKKLPKKVEEKLHDLTTKLNLTAEQQTQVKDILLKSKEECKTLWVEAKTKINDVRSKAHDQIAVLLTDDQKEKFKEVRKECEVQKQQEEDE